MAGRWCGWVVGAAIGLPGMLAGASAAGLDGCYVGALPCGSEARMAHLVARCLADPAACGSLGGQRPAVVEPGRHSSPARPLPADAAPPRRMAGQARRTGDSLPAGDAAEAARAARTIDRLARALPIEPWLHDLEDRLPPDPLAVERALGLRRPVGAATDLRDGVPDVERLLHALAPGRGN
ncbi:hypothetical protein [Roseicella aerolata]|uniref:Uncharacterized protein n=1 Tax=Roseicella aerolata TaxID=2883479 RepID=A0A9X1L7I8_9PROT|nr:hypothetical protein [Roseicella aerolata]MCB4822026.1 hypothetical protein [Roseicella aerolata]